MRSIPRLDIFFVTSFLLSTVLLAFRVLDFTDINVLDIVIYLVLIIVFGSLFYLSYFDFKKMEVHNSISFVLMISLLILNILVFKYTDIDIGIELKNGYIFNPVSNFLGALVLGSIFQLIVILSKEKALGQGDVRISIIVGLLIGWNNLIGWLYITIFSALFYGLILAKEKGKFRGLHIPFVPFMVLGIIVVLLWGI